MSRKDRMSQLDQAIGGLAAERRSGAGAARSMIPIVNQIENVFSDSAAELERLRREGHVLLELDPAEIEDSVYADRHAAAYADSAFEEFVQDVLRNGQLVPILVRAGDGGGGYTLIAGRRRLAACRRLGRKVLARTMAADERAQLVMMVRENEARQDISPYERAVQLKTVIDRGLMTRAEVMETLGVSKGHLSSLLKFSELPGPVVEALGDPRGLRIADGARLVRLLDDPDARRRVMDTAAELKDTALGFEARLKALFGAAAGRGTAHAPPTSSDRLIKSRTGQILVRLASHDGRPILRLAAGLPPEMVDRLFDRLPELLREVGLDVDPEAGP